MPPDNRLKYLRKNLITGSVKEVDCLINPIITKRSWNWDGITAGICGKQPSKVLFPSMPLHLLALLRSNTITCFSVQEPEFQMLRSDWLGMCILIARGDSCSLLPFIMLQYTHHWALR